MATKGPYQNVYLAPIPTLKPERSTSKEVPLSDSVQS